MTQAIALRSPTESVLARFLRYVAIDTQSAEDVDVGPEHAGPVGHRTAPRRRAAPPRCAGHPVERHVRRVRDHPGKPRRPRRHPRHRADRPHGYRAGCLGCERQGGHPRGLPGRRHRAPRGPDAGHHGRCQSRPPGHARRRHHHGRRHDAPRLRRQGGHRHDPDDGRHAAREPGDPRTGRSRSRSRRTRSRAQASRRSTSMASGPRSPTPSTGTASASSTTRRGTLERRRSRSPAGIRIRGQPRVSW